MINITKLDMDPKPFSKIYMAINLGLKQIKSKPNTEEFAKDVFDLFNRIYPKDFIIFVSKEVIYNVQTKQKCTLMGKVQNLSVLVFKARPFAFPTLHRFEQYLKPDELKYITENENPNLKRMEVVRNNYVKEEDMEEIKSYIHIYVNKHQDERDLLMGLLRNLKIILLGKSGSLFTHLVITDKKKSHYRLPEEANLTEDTKQLVIDFDLKSTNKSHTLVIFEKQGESDGFLHRCLKKWKEFFIFLFMFLIVAVLSVCRAAESTYLGYDVEFICNNRSNFLFTLGIGVVGFVILKNYRPKRAKRN